MSKELYHYGVRGMRWGVRNKRVPSKDSQNVSDIRKKRVREMSNDELRTANNRLQLERQYKDLTNKKTINKVIKGFVATAGTITAVTAAAKIYKKTGSDVLNKIGDWVVKDIKF